MRPTFEVAERFPSLIIGEHAVDDRLQTGGSDRANQLQQAGPIADRDVAEVRSTGFEREKLDARVVGTQEPDRGDFPAHRHSSQGLRIPA